MARQIKGGEHTVLSKARANTVYICTSQEYVYLFPRPAEWYLRSPPRIVIRQAHNIRKRARPNKATYGKVGLRALLRGT